MPHLWERDTTVTSSSVFQFSNHFILYSREIEPKYIQEEFILMSNFTSTHGNRMKSALRTKLPNMAGPFIEAFKNISSIVYISTTIVLFWLFINFHIDLLEHLVTSHPVSSFSSYESVCGIFSKWLYRVFVDLVELLASEMCHSACAQTS